MAQYEIFVVEADEKFLIHRLLTQDGMVSQVRHAEHIL